MDTNQTAIVVALREIGCNVLSLAAIGQGCPDLLVYRHATGLLYLLEVKDGAKSASRRRLTPHQKQFHADWPVHVVKNEIEAMVVVGLCRT